MNDIKKIVVPIDMDQHTGTLVDFALFIAGKLNASVRFIHVVEDIVTGDMMLGSPSYEILNEERTIKAQELMANITEDNSDKCADLDGRVVRGEIVGEIVRFAKEEDAGLVIIGTHGAKGLEKILLGSVAERVLKGVHCPTLTMNPYR